MHSVQTPPDEDAGKDIAWGGHTLAGRSANRDCESSDSFKISFRRCAILREKVRSVHVGSR